MDAYNANQIYIANAEFPDLEKILALQKVCYQSEAKLCNDWTIQPLTQTMEDITGEFMFMKFLKITVDDEIIASVRAYEKEGTVYIGKVIVDPRYQGRGIGTKILAAVEALYDVHRFELFTGEHSERNLYFYKKAGYHEFKKERVNDKVTLVFLEKIK